VLFKRLFIFQFVLLFFLISLFLDNSVFALAFMPPPPSPDPVTLVANGSTATASWTDSGWAYYYYVAISTSDTFIDWSEDVGAVAPLSSKEFTGLAAGTYYVYVSSADFSLIWSTPTRSNAVTINETIPPTINSVSSDKANGTYGEAEIIDIDIFFSEAVTSTGDVTITLETGSTDRSCTFSVSNASTASCNYSVQAGDSTSDLNQLLISGVIVDQVGNTMTSFTPTTSLAVNKDLVINTSEEEVAATTNEESSETTEDSSSCSAEKPSSTPDLYQIEASDNSAKLFFTPPTNSVTGYTVEYGTTSSANEFAVAFSNSDTTGAVTYNIENLTTQKTWYFRVKANNDCVGTAWSNTKSTLIGEELEEVEEEVVEEVATQEAEIQVPEVISQPAVLGIATEVVMDSDFSMLTLILIWLGLILFLIILVIVWRKIRKRNKNLS
jgi:hypothetical protein